MSQLQSVVFNNKQFTPTLARAWLKENNLIAVKKVDITKNTLRYRIRSPARFKRFRTKIVSQGVMLVLGFK